MQDYLAAAKSGDWNRAFDMMSEDVVMTVPGRSAYAGRYEGKEAMREYLDAALAGTTNVEVEMVDMLAGEEHMALVLRERIERPDRVLEMSRVNVYRVRDGKIVEALIYEANQYEVDEFMQAQAARA
jgi:ketosteroid isomerase-like protein